mgnify:CR=1 FL=1
MDDALLPGARDVPHAGENRGRGDGPRVRADADRVDVDHGDRGHIGRRDERPDPARADPGRQRRAVGRARARARCRHARGG